MDLAKPKHQVLLSMPNQQVEVDEPTLQLIYKSIKDVADDDGWANLSTLGNHLATNNP